MKTVIHKRVSKQIGAVRFYTTVCGRGHEDTYRNDRVTCGRCKLLAKFAAKRAKKGTR